MVTEINTDWPTFKWACSFGYLTDEDYQGVLDNSLSYNPREHTTSEFSKDHKFSRNRMWELANEDKINDLLSFSMMAAMINYASRYEINIPNNATKRAHRIWIAAVACGHPANAELLTKRANSIKGANCSHSLKDLHNKIIKWESEY